MAWTADIRAAQHAVADADSLTEVLDTSGLTTWGDGVHYDGAGQLELGRRIAAIVEAP